MHSFFVCCCLIRVFAMLCFNFFGFLPCFNKNEVATNLFHCVSVVGTEETSLFSAPQKFKEWVKSSLSRRKYRNMFSLYFKPNNSKKVTLKNLIYEYTVQKRGLYPSFEIKASAASTSNNVLRLYIFCFFVTMWYSIVLFK